MDYQKVRSEKENSRMHQNDRNNLSWVKDIKTLKGNWTCMHIRRGRDRDRDQGHPKSRVSPEQVEIKMKKTNFIQRRKPLEEVWGKSPKWPVSEMGRLGVALLHHQLPHHRHPRCWTQRQARSHHRDLGPPKSPWTPRDREPFLFFSLKRIRMNWFDFEFDDDDEEFEGTVMETFVFFPVFILWWYVM